MKKEQVDKMTVQEAVDYTVLKIVEQGGRCLNEKGKCRYADSDHHCPVGWLLDPDDKSLMEFTGSVYGLTQHPELNIPTLIHQNVTVFGDLQNFHDKAEKYKRVLCLGYLSEVIDTSAPQYQQWVNMGE